MERLQIRMKSHKKIIKGGEGVARWGTEFGGFVLWHLKVVVYRKTGDLL